MVKLTNCAIDGLHLPGFLLCLNEFTYIAVTMPGSVDEHSAKIPQHSVALYGETEVVRCSELHARTTQQHWGESEVHSTHGLSVNCVFCRLLELNLHRFLHGEITRWSK